MRDNVPLEQQSADDLPSGLRGFRPDGTPLGGANAIEHLIAIAEAYAQERHVADDYFDVDGRQVRVSTVFMVTDQGHGLSARPLLWETMTFTDGTAGRVVRTATREDALLEHANSIAVAKQRNG